MLCKSNGKKRVKIVKKLFLFFFCYKILELIFNENWWNIMLYYSFFWVDLIFISNVIFFVLKYNCLFIYIVDLIIFFIILYFYLVLNIYKNVGII